MKINMVSRVRKCPEQKWKGREGEIDKLLKNTDEESVALDHKEKPHHASLVIRMCLITYTGK